MNRYIDNINLNETERNTLNIMSFNLMKRCEKKLNATCKILNSNGTSKGTGFFCEIKLNNKLTKVLFTNNHVLNDYNSNIKIEYDRKIRVLKKENRFFYTNEDLDYSCIEILDSDNFNNYFKVDKNINNNNPEEEYKYDQLVIIQFPGGNTVKFGEGYINKINKESIIYSIMSEGGSSGSPICLDTRNLKVIGIHRGKADNENINLKRGIFMKDIIQDIQKQIKKDNTYQKSNEQKNIVNKSDNKYNNEGNNKKNIKKEKDNNNINNKNKIPQNNQIMKFNPIGKYEYENKEYDLYSEEQLEENKYCW